MPYFTWRVSRRSRFSQSPYNCKLTMQKPWGHLSAPHAISGKILWFTSFHPWPCRKECRFGFPRGQGFEIEAEVARKCDPVDRRNPATQLMFGEYAIFPQGFMCTKTDGAGFLPSTVWPPTRVNVLHIIHHWPYYIHLTLPNFQVWSKTYPSFWLCFTLPICLSTSSCMSMPVYAHGEPSPLRVPVM